MDIYIFVLDLPYEHSLPLMTAVLLPPIEVCAPNRHMPWEIEHAVLDVLEPVQKLVVLQS
jgi:hypothetical protein